MAVSPQGMSVQALYRAYRDGQLFVNRQYQRKLVWTVAEKQALIDSILKDYPLPLFLLAEKQDASGKPILEIVDGMQRLNAIFSFIENGFQIDQKCFDVNWFARAKQAAEAGQFAEFPADVERLSPELCANLLDYQLAMTVFPGDQNGHITEVFGRINSGGRQLSDQERRQAGVLSPFAETVRVLAAEIRGDVSRETLLLSEMPEISIETIRNPHGYTLKAEDIFWTYHGILRTGDLRESDDEQILADICASILFEEPAEASVEFLNRIYTAGTDEAREINSRIASYGRDRLSQEVKMTFSAVRSTLEKVDPDRFAFRRIVYPKPTSNAQKSPFFAVFMAFHGLIFREGMVPVNETAIIKALNNLADRIKVGQKQIKSEDRKENIAVVNGLIREGFAKQDVSILSHGPGLVFDFENSVRRSRTETARYEFKQGILRLDNARTLDKDLLRSLVETFTAIANLGPDADGYVYIGIADKPQDAARVKALDGVDPIQFEQVQIVGVDREARVLSLPLDRYMRLIEDEIRNSPVSEPLKTQLLSNIDAITYKGRSIVRVRVPKQVAPTFIGDECFIRVGTGTFLAKGPQIAAIAKLFR
jgi:hypothetical protein